MAETRKRNRAPAVKRDALIEALIKRLPVEGAAWPVVQRLAWLRMAVQAFDVSYGVVEGITVDPVSGAMLMKALEQPGVASGIKEAVVAASNVTPLRRPTAEEIAALDEPRYYIRADGMAFGPGNARVKATDVPGDAIIEDERPVGQQDIDSIVWADGSWPAAALPPLSITSAAA